MPDPSAPSAHLAVDLGSSSIRVMLGVLTAGDDGERHLSVQQVARFDNVPIERPEGLGWDIPTLWAGVRAGLAAGVRAARHAGAEIRGIGVDSWGVDYGRLTAGGVLRDFVRHHRDADPVLASRTSAERDLTADYAVTGVLDQAINTAHQLRQDAAAGVGDPADTLLPIADLFVWLLTGRIGAELSLASTTALLDRRADTWSGALTAGLPAQLPSLVGTGASAGSTTREVTEAIGADAPIAVWAVTAHDTAAAFMAVTDADDSGTGVVSSGSWAVVGLALPHPILDDRARALGFTQEIGADGATLLVKNLSGMWLLQQALREWAAVDDVAPGSLGTLRRLLGEAAVSDYRGRFDPADPTLQAPHDLVARLQSACAASGAGAPASRADLVRAIVGSLALAYADTLAQAEELTGRTLERVRVLGGGARNELLCTLTASHAGLPVVAGPVEASIRGVLLQSAIAAGDLPDAAAARAVVVDDGEPADRVFPTPSTLPIGEPA